MKLLGGRYQLVEKIAEGGMATVWRATAHGAGEFTFQVAIKVMLPHFRLLADYVAMFIEEARIGSTLNHPHLVNVLDFFEQGRDYCLVLEWIEGADLGRVQRRTGVLPWWFVAHVGIGVLRGLGAAHRRVLPNGELAPVLHRDVSPENILLGCNGAVKLADFGLARARDRVAKLTAPGTAKGKLSYLAPEIARGHPPTPRSDIFSLGCTLWEALTGRRLWFGSNDIEVLGKIMKGEVPPIGAYRQGVPPSLVALVTRALATRPEERFASAGEMIDALHDVLHTDGPRTDSYDEIARQVARMRQTAEPESEEIDLDEEDTID